MSRLPYDYARCVTEECPLAVQCLRRLDSGREEYQTFAMFPGGEDCHGFIGAELKEKSDE